MVESTEKIELKLVIRPAGRSDHRAMVVLRTVQPELVAPLHTGAGAGAVLASKGSLRGKGAGPSRFSHHLGRRQGTQPASASRASASSLTSGVICRPGVVGPHG